MGIRIAYSNDSTNADEQTRGSDGRLNVSSRTDSRGYYNSRDESESYSLVWADASTATGDHIIYWKNTNANGKQFVVTNIGINSQYRADFQLQAVTGTAAGGAVGTPSCLNRAVKKTAAATARTAVTGDITGLTVDVIIDHVSVEAGGHEEIHLDDRLRLGQDDAIAVECILTDTSPGLTWGVIYGYYE